MSDKSGFLTKLYKGFLIVITLVLISALLVPFLIPVPPLENTTSAQELADADSQFIEINNISVHYKIFGSGEPVFILLHGFGASTFSWREVMPSLAEHGTVIAYDRPAFGLTERPLPGEWVGENPYSLETQVELLIALMNAKEIQKAVLVGNSAGGTVGFATALQYPQRVQGLMAVDAAIYSSSANSPFLQFLLHTPQMQHVGPLISRSIAGERGDDFIRSAWHDPSKITPEVLAGYRKPLQMENWDVALWQLTLAAQKNTIAENLSSLSMPVLVVTGDDDRIVPTAESIKLSEEIPGAKLVIFEDCGHVPQEECPVQFLSAIYSFDSFAP